MDVADIVADNADDLLRIIGGSLAYLGTNAFIGAHHGAEIMLALAPPWADLIARDVPTSRCSSQRLWEHASACRSLAGPTPTGGAAERMGGSTRRRPRPPGREPGPPAPRVRRSATCTPSPSTLRPNVRRYRAFTIAP